ncbi:MAG: hypothetical protein CL833_16250 [Crocinitomicaceae bacterium]|nr:hypothetical protein [Crocinitomicaceae bacterium]|tara:strand:+ start:60 stop:401 length:342 start_codon:yes stop_codon:yes gene_type:complete
MDTTKTYIIAWQTIAVLLGVLWVLSILSERNKHSEEILKLEQQIQDYQDMIVTLDVAYDSLLVAEQEIQEEYHETIVHIDTVSIDSIRNAFAERYGFFDLLHTDTTSDDSQGH